MTLDSARDGQGEPRVHHIGPVVRSGVVDVVVIAPQMRSDDTFRRWRVLTLRRAAGTRCTGAWEIVHGRIEAGESASDAAVRETREETGLDVLRLYSITVNPFYLPPIDTVDLAVVFAAVVNGEAPVALGAEHDRAKWRSAARARARLAWPREREAVSHVRRLLSGGDAGPVEDVLRVR